MHVVKTDDAWFVWHPNGMARRPDGWNSGQIGRPDGMVRSSRRLTGALKTSVLKAVQNHLECF
jgi:hypothetical protein